LLTAAIRRKTEIRDLPESKTGTNRLRSILPKQSAANGTIRQKLQAAGKKCVIIVY